MAKTPPEWRHPKGDDLYTPITVDVIELLHRMKNEYGTWRKVAAVSDTRLKVIRRLRRSHALKAHPSKAVSQKLLDRLITTTGVGSLADFTWFTAQDLVELGIWEPNRYFGLVDDGM